MAERVTRGFTPFEAGQKVWLDAKNLKWATLPKSSHPEGKDLLPSQRKSFLSYWLQLDAVEDTPCLSHLPSHPLQRKWCPWNKLPGTTTGPYRRRTQVLSRSNHHTPMFQVRAPVPHQMERLLHLQELVGTRATPHPCPGTPDLL